MLLKVKERKRCYWKEKSEKKDVTQRRKEKKCYYKSKREKDVSESRKEKKHVTEMRKVKKDVTESRKETAKQCLMMECWNVFPKKEIYCLVIRINFGQWVGYILIS